MNYTRVNFVDEAEMLSFIDRHWDRVFCVNFNDDYDGRYWVVNLLPKV